jgi:hypothetical protein
MMRSRLTSLLLVAPLIATGIALLDAAPAAAEDTGEHARHAQGGGCRWGNEC